MTDDYAALVEEMKCSKKLEYMPQYHFTHHKFHTDYHGIWSEVDGQSPYLWRYQCY